MSAVDILTHAGYFTLKAIQGHIAKIDYANEEIRRSLAQFYTLQLLGGKTVEQVDASNITHLLADDDTKSFLLLLNKLLNTIDYQSFPDRNETTLAAFARVLFTGIGIKTIWLKQKGILMLQVGSQIWKIEFSKVFAETKKINVDCKSLAHPKLMLSKSPVTEK